jgi:hypothetical protein
MANLSNINNKFLVTTGGNVGIGVTSPGAVLDIYSPYDVTANPDSTGIRLRRVAGGSQSYLLGMGVSGVSNDYFAIRDITNSAYRFVLTNGGNVGIGIDTPQTLLNVNSLSGTTYPTLGTASGVIALSINELHGMYLGVDGPSGNGWIQAMREDASATAYNLILQPSGGNVGIGLTDTSSVKLGVSGNSGLPATSGTTQTGLLRLKASNNATLDMGCDHTTAQGWLQVTDVTSLSTEYNLLLQPNGGNVGIGTTSPSSNKPNGSLIGTGWSVSNNIALEISAPNSASSGANSGLFLRNSNSSTGTDITSDNYFGNTFIDNRFDNDNGDIYFRTRTAGTPQTRMIIEGGGNVGIGTDSPSGLTHFYGNGNSTYIVNQKNSTKWSEWHVGGTDHAFIWDSTADMRFMTATSLNGGGASEKMRINSSGQVNINQKPNSGLEYDLLINLGTSPDGLIGYQTREQFNNATLQKWYNVDVANSGSSQWVRLGTLSNFAQGGFTFCLTFFGHLGYNASNDQDFNCKLFMKTSNGNGAGPLFNSWVENTGKNQASPAFKWINKNASGTPTVGGTSYELYMNVPAFCNGSIYSINKHSGDWTSENAIGQTDPGANSTTVLQAANVFNILNTNVGIGTTSPGAKLEVVGTSYLRGDTYTDRLLPYSGQQLTLLSGGANTLFVNGNVGIGTTANISSPLTVQTDGSANSISIIGRNNGANDEAIISFYEYDGTTRNCYIIKEGGDLAIATGTGGSPSERMRIRSGGGIINQYRSGINVGQTATAITSASTYGGIAMVWMNYVGNIGYDLVSWSLSQVTVLSSQSISGGTSSRTYTSVNGVLKLQMGGSDTYATYVSDITNSPS